MLLGMIMPLWSMGKSASPDCESQKERCSLGAHGDPRRGQGGREGRTLDQIAGSLGSAPTHS